VVSQYGYLFFRTVVQSVGATVVLAPEHDYRTDPEAMLAKAGSRTRVMFIANPNNPTGSLLTRAEVLRLRASLRDDVILVLDGAYAEYVEDPEFDPGAELVDMTSNTVMIRTFSKAHGLAGLRVGWGYFPQAIADALNRIRHPNAITAPAIAAAAASIVDRDHIEHVREKNATHLTWFTRELRTLGLKPLSSHGNFVLVRFASAQAAVDAHVFLRTAGIIVRPMSAYDLGDCLRITIGTRDELAAVRDALQALPGSYR
jgi:histidinol-phosphate aminotransferase